MKAIATSLVEGLWWLVKLPILLIGCVMQILFWVFEPMSRYPTQPLEDMTDSEGDRVTDPRLLRITTPKREVRQSLWMRLMGWLRGLRQPTR